MGKFVGIYRGLCSVTLQGKLLDAPKPIKINDTTTKAAFVLYIDYPPSAKAIEAAKANNTKAESERVFFTCEAWGKTAERIIQHGQKGWVVTGNFEVHANNYETKAEDGTAIKNRGHLYRLQPGMAYSIVPDAHWVDDDNDTEKPAEAAQTAAVPEKTGDADSPQELDELPF